MYVQGENMKSTHNNMWNIFVHGNAFNYVNTYDKISHFFIEKNAHIVWLTTVIAHFSYHHCHFLKFFFSETDYSLISE